MNNIIELVIFPSDHAFKYLKNTIKTYNFKNPVYAYYNFNNAEICNLCYQEKEVGLRLKVALDFISKFCQEKKVKVYLFTPDISEYNEKININEYIDNENIIELNYIVEKSELLWTKDSDDDWFNNSKIKLIIHN